MIKRHAGTLAFFVVLLMILIPSVHVPMLSDDFAYYYAVGATISGQLQHYMGWSGRIVTNIISSYMMNWLPHAAYEGLTAMVLSIMIYLYACLPSAIKDRSLKAHWAAVLIIFIFYWIANPSLGQTSFWFVGAANYVWPNFFLSIYFVCVLRQIKKPSIVKMPLMLFIGFLAGCSNENTCIVAIILTIAYVFYNKNASIIAPYFIGLITGASVLLFSPGGAARSTVFTSWHSLSLIEKVDEQMFNRMPQAMQTYWLVYILVIVLALFISMYGILSRRNSIYAAVFFVAAVMANMAFIGAPFMPIRAYNGALCFMLISASFLISTIINESSKWQKIPVLSLIFTFGLVYFIPSYFMFTDAVMKTWKQESIRQFMIKQQLSAGVMDIVIPDFYMTRLLKKEDSYPDFKQPMVKDLYKVNSFTEYSVAFDYSSLDNIPSYNAGVELDSGFILQKIYFYEEKISRKRYIIYQINDDINKMFAQGKTISVHTRLRDKKGFINMDTSNAAVKIADSWLTYSDITDKGIEFKDIESMSIGAYQFNPVKTL